MSPSLRSVATLCVALLTTSAFAQLPADTQSDLAPPPPTLALAHNIWMKRAPLWSDRRQLATALVTNAAGQSVVYAIGGTSATSVQSKVMAYNTVTNTWSLKAPLPRALHSTNGAGVIDGKIYVSGGFYNFRLSAYIPASSQLYRYDQRVMSRRPFTFLAGSSPVFKRVLHELAQSQQFRRRMQTLRPVSRCGFVDLGRRPSGETWRSMP